MTVRNAAAFGPRRRGVFYLAVMAAALGGPTVAGCGHDAALPPEPDPRSQVTLKAIDAKGLADAVAQQRGKVVIVDFWATWCIPCRALFPHAVELHRRLATRGLAVISVSMDDVDKQEEAVRFLHDHQARFGNFISRYGLGSEGFEAFDITDGGLPHLKLYDRQGRLRKTFASGTTPLDPPEIDRAVEELLK